LNFIFYSIKILSRLGIIFFYPW